MITVNADGTKIDWGNCNPGNYSCLRAAQTANPVGLGAGPADIVCNAGVLPGILNPLCIATKVGTGVVQGVSGGVSGIPGKVTSQLTGLIGGKDGIIRVALFIIGVILIAGGVHGITGVSVVA